MGEGIGITYILSDLITNNITKKSLSQFVKDLEEDDYKSSCKLNEYISKLISDKRLSKLDVNKYLFKELFYGQQKDVYIHSIYNFNIDILSKENLYEIISKKYKVSSDFYNILTDNIDNAKEETQLVACKSKEDFETDELINIRMIFACKIKKLNNKGDIIEEFSYIPIEIDLVKKIIVCKVSPKTNLIDESYRPTELYEKYFDIVLDMFEIEINSYNTKHKTALYNMSDELYNQIYKKMISSRETSLNDLIKDFSNKAKAKVNISNIDKKAQLNKIFNTEEYLKKYFDQIIITDILSSRSFKSSDRESIEGVVTYLRFNDGSNVSAKVRGENFKASIYTSETYMALRDTIENSSKISEMNVIWILEDKDLRVKYNTNSCQYLFMHFYKNFCEEDFRYGYRKYKEYESIVVQKTDRLAK